MASELNEAGCCMWLYVKTAIRQKLYEPVLMTCMHSLQNACSSVKAVNTSRSREIRHDQELLQIGHRADGIFLLGNDALTG